MNIEPSGVLLVGECDIQTEECTAKVPAPITAVWSSPARRQINVCSSCMEEMVRRGEWQNKGARIRHRADVAVFDKLGNLQLVVEAKYVKPNEDTSHRAVQIRRNLLAHSGIPNTPYFLIVFPDRSYLWKQGLPDRYDRQADYSMDSEIVLQSYAGECKAFGPSPRAFEFERLVSDWIEGLTTANDTSKIPEWARNSGLYDAIKNGSVVVEATI